MSKKKHTNFLIVTIVIISLLLIISFISSERAKRNEQQKIDQLFDREIIFEVQEFEDQGIDHISEPNTFAYNSNPPTSGPHYGRAPNWGFYPEPIDDESALHAVEHGGLWVSFKDLDTAEIDLLKEFAEHNSQSVIVTPRPENDARIAAVTWTKLVEFDQVDIDALQKFLILNKNKTHEPLAG